MQCLRLAALVILAGVFSCAWAQTSASVARFYTVANLPPAASYNNKTVLVTDGTSPTDCTTGGGGYGVHCHSNGTAWSALSTVTNNNQLTNGAGFITAAGAPVQKVAGRTGTVTLSHSDITDWSTATSGFGVSSNTPTYNVGAGGVTQNTLVTGDLNPNEVVTPTLGGFCGFGVAQATVASGGTVQVMQNGLVQIMTDKSVPVGDIAICSTTTAGYITDSCQTSLNGIPNTTQAIGVVTTASTGPGTLATIRLYDSTKYGTNVSVQAAAASAVQSVNGQTGAITNVVQYPLNTFSVVGQAVFGSFNSNGQSYINTTVSGNAPENSDLYIFNNSSSPGAHQLLGLVANNGGSGINMERSSNSYSNLINLLTGTGGNDIWSIQTTSSSEDLLINHWDGTNSYSIFDAAVQGPITLYGYKTNNSLSAGDVIISNTKTPQNNHQELTINTNGSAGISLIRGSNTYQSQINFTTGTANKDNWNFGVANGSSNFLFGYWNGTTYFQPLELFPNGQSSTTFNTLDDGSGNMTVAASLTSKTFINTVSTATFSATPTFDVSTGNMQKIVLTGSVTSSTITNLKQGETVDFQICQNATGGYTFAWPTNVHGGMTVGTTASTCSMQSFKSWDGTTLYASTTGVANVP